MSVIIGTYINYWLGFGASKIFIFHVQYTSIIIIFYVQTTFMIMIHVSFHLGLSSIIIISHILCASIIIIIIIDIDLVIFQNVAWIVLGSNIINYNSIPSSPCQHASPSHKRVVIVASLLWLTFVDKIRGGAVSYRCWSGPSRCAIGFLLSWTPGQIGIPLHRPLAYGIILYYYVILFLISGYRFLVLSSPAFPCWWRSILDHLYNLYQVYTKKNWWSILVTRTTSPIFNQFASEILHSVIHLRIYDMKQAYEFVCYIGKILSQKNVGKIYFSSELFLLVMVRHISNFNIFISNFLHCVLYLMK